MHICLTHPCIIRSIRRTSETQQWKRCNFKILFVIMQFYASIHVETEVCRMNNGTQSQETAREDERVVFTHLWYLNEYKQKKIIYMHCLMNDDEKNEKLVSTMTKVPIHSLKHVYMLYNHFCCLNETHIQTATTYYTAQWIF